MENTNFKSKIVFGDCRESLRQLAADGVKAQMCVTSPPYFGLRDYGVDGQLGLEQTPEEYVAAMVEVFRCVRDVLSDDGVLWLNIGDSYNAAGRTGHGTRVGYKQGTNRASAVGADSCRPSVAGLKEKDLIGIPWMLAFALRADGWYLRQDIIWNKPNPMPESVRDRCTKAHEYVFLLSKSPRYFYDWEAVKEPAVGGGEVGTGVGWNHASKTDPRDGREGRARSKRDSFKRDEAIPGQAYGTHRPDREESSYDTATRNRRSVWTIATRPYKGAHFATFPPALIEPCILAGTSQRGHCPECGARWVREVERETSFQSSSAKAGRTPEEIAASGKHAGGVNGGNKNLKAGPCVTTVTIGWRASCSCGHDPVPDIVLDPFMGSGTAAEVAIKLGRQYLGCELNEDYKPLQDQRIAAAIASLPRQLELV